jgi:hypothetical protein
VMISRMVSAGALGGHRSILPSESRGTVSSVIR